MLRKALWTALVLSLAGAACDDADPPRPRDAGSDARQDAAADAGRDSGADRMMDSGTPIDSAVADAPAADVPRDTAAADVPRDTALADAPTPDAPSPDTAPPDTALPDTALPDTALPDTQSLDTGPAAVDAQAPLALNDCEEADFLDATTDPDLRIQGWANDDPSPRCLKIKVGQTVTWTLNDGDTFATHPIEAFPTVAGGPIDGKNAADDADYEEDFPAAGTFGFRCTIHQGTMKGAIWVVP